EWARFNAALDAARLPFERLSVHCTVRRTENCGEREKGRESIMNIAWLGIPIEARRPWRSAGPRLRAAGLIASAMVAIPMAVPAAAHAMAPESFQFVLPAFGVNQFWRVDQHPRFLADITGDGRADIVGMGDAGVYTAVANGSGGFAPRQF